MSTYTFNDDFFLVDKVVSTLKIDSFAYSPLNSILFYSNNDNNKQYYLYLTNELTNNPYTCNINIEKSIFSKKSTDIYSINKQSIKRHSICNKVIELKCQFYITNIDKYDYFNFIDILNDEMIVIQYNIVNIIFLNKYDLSIMFQSYNYFNLSHSNVIVNIYFSKDYSRLNIIRENKNDMKMSLVTTILETKYLIDDRENEMYDGLDNITTLFINIIT